MDVSFSKLGILLLLIVISTKLYAQAGCDKICGKWESSEKNLIVEVYKIANDYKAKIIWFNAGSEKLMQNWVDENNPDKALRSRKLLGMNVLTGLNYVPGSNSWENGMIYDAKHGREWNASAYITDKGVFKVKGYWHFKFIGRTMTFTKV
jgi:uncharacterized protein (DUF2147 family)